MFDSRDFDDGIDSLRFQQDKEFKQRTEKMMNQLVGDDSSDLDKKLEETLVSFGNGVLIGAPIKKLGVAAQADIKQAFIDEGWQKPSDLGQIAYTTIYKDGKTTLVPSQPDLITKDQWEQQARKDNWVKVPDSHQDHEGIIFVSNKYPVKYQDGTALMTGQEWYDKFEKEKERVYQSWPHSKEKTWLSNGASLAAKKAAGIE